MRTLQVISLRRIPSRSRLVNTMKRVYDQRRSVPSLQNDGWPTNVRKLGAASRHFWIRNCRRLLGEYVHRSTRPDESFTRLRRPTRREPKWVLDSGAAAPPRQGM